jgi:hypothetical protein
MWILLDFLLFSYQIHIIISENFGYVDTKTLESH